jgi:hypothetical protein
MSSPDDATPGKTRTWWHPLLVTLLEQELSQAFEIRDEMSVGTLPLRADVILVRRGEAEIPDSARRSFPVLTERLNRWTLIEFKSPVDSLEHGDLDRLFGIGHLFFAQQSPSIGASDVSFVILAPVLTKPFEADVRRLGLSLVEDEPGVWQIVGGLFTTWLLEIDRLTRLDEPGLSVFSRVLLQDRRLIMEMVRDPETQPILLYVFQQIRQFQQLGEAFMVQHTRTAEMDQEYAALKEAFVQSLTPEDLAMLLPEERLAGLSPEERMAALSPEERLAGLSPEERLAGLSPEDRLAGLSPDERSRLFQRLCEEGFTPPGKPSHG